ncbi:iron ABC transporter permease [Thermoactinomyces vulgaris]|uniref:Iron ABC transporter permease n=1 Tax=Thermoactinomyces vulgaris TaxID=2026 RepID=A0ABS0QL54_THEVU|nr:iron ABC transporter permease [Thermoactinomyces vulgaris]MBA4551954.1 iron ABC transporter permease [Thermoactinomyces vulgaris]MBA4596766.1 iron ABC transporter permease [Thermoactinomyces vulgaris]MBH8589509.1 iron ABC transporter permease [Thermoactinomyces vulgaris]
MTIGRRKWLWGGGLLVALILSVSLGVFLGSTDVGFWTVWKVILQHTGLADGLNMDEADAAIIWELRLPRVLLVGLVGACLATAGVIYQGLLKNHLADPYILGVSSGAAVGAALVIITGWGDRSGWMLPLFAFLGACLALLLVLQLGRGRRASQASSLILAGVVVQAFFSAVLTLAISTSPEEMQRIQFWLMGSFAFRGWQHIGLLLPFFLIGFLVCWRFSRELNLMVLGERSAHHLGIHVEKMRIFLLIIVSLMTSAAVSVSGMIGFVGLVVPHIMRMLTGADHRYLLPLSALFGASFLIWADGLSRIMLAPRELPIGVVTAFVGAPFFAGILRRHQRSQG